MTDKTIAKLSIGDKVVRLTILEIARGYTDDDGKKIKAKALCRCSCGKEFTANQGDIKSNNTKSCGCLRGESHGGSHVPEYNIWRAMKARCSRATQADYKDYGGRGITVCDRWKGSFSTFLSDMGERPSKEYSIDRINNEGNYEPSNCKWSTVLEQAQNKRPRKDYLKAQEDKDAS